MDQEVLVREQVGGGRKLLESLVGSGVPVTAAFWTKTDDDDRWYLYIVSPWADTRGSRDVSAHIHQAILGLSDQWSDALEAVDPLSVKVLESNHPLAKGVNDVLKRYPGPFDTWYRTSWVGETAVSGMFIYSRIPAITPVAGS